MVRERKFGPTFQAHAAPEAIRAHLIELRRKRSTIDGDINKLEQLLIERTRQMQRGEWPPEAPTDG